jgi:cytosine/adenosine deaminase-related metal-dependent hydrolase
MPNLHSHAFQRAFGGLTEFRGQAQDSFWSWRKLMYGFANRMTPEALEAIATWLYLEMLEAGYTSVCEFHYVHHDVGGKPYANDASLSLALLRAAQKTGIGMTLLPVLYQTSGFGAAASRGSGPLHSQHGQYALPAAAAGARDQGAAGSSGPGSALAARRAAGQPQDRARRPARHAAQGAGAHPYRRADPGGG